MIKQKDYESAINYYNKAINLNPSDAILYFERGQLLSKMKNYKNAENDLIIASSLNENLVASNVNLMSEKYIINSVKEINLLLSLIKNSQ